MIPIERFESLLNQAVLSLPEELYQHLNLGVSLLEGSKKNPDTASGRPAYVLGEYHVRRGLGKGIVLYYESFNMVYPCMNDESLCYERILSVLKHELTHHWEHLAGDRDLIIEDAKRLREM